MVSVILHECAHGWVAYMRGDPTAKLEGRLTLNPIKHIDPFGTIILPALLITLRILGYSTVVLGWAKPVPVNFARLYRPKTDMIWVALAGPVTNILLAVLLSLFLRPELPLNVVSLLAFAIFINLLLAIFNLMPIPPLDGSRILMGLLPTPLALAYSRLERYGILIVFLLLSLGIFDRFVVPVVDFCGRWLGVEFP